MSRHPISGPRVGLAAALRISLAAFISTIVFSPTGSASGTEVYPLAPLTGKDRLLVLAPHEDDEALSAGGMIQQAVDAGAPVRVVYLTYGDHNELSFLVYRKRLWLSPAFNRTMGETRRRESIAAMASLGVGEKSLVFLGYPDNGTLDIWRRNWGLAPPLHSILINARRVPYVDAYAYNQPYKGEAILGDLERQILDFRPTRILVSHPLDGNPDHRAYYLFLQVALLDAAIRLPPPPVFAYPTHAGSWPNPARYEPDQSLAVPRHLTTDPSPWWSFDLTAQQVVRKHDAILQYKSQVSDRSSWMTAFARRNEIFSTPLPVLLQGVTGSGAEPTVPRHMAMESSEIAEYLRDEPGGQVTGVSYHDSEEGLIVQIGLRGQIDSADLEVSLYAFGYRRGKPFGDMPKLRLKWEDGGMRVYDKSALIRSSQVQVSNAKKQVICILPWELLGSPEIVFAQVQAMDSGITVSQTGWQVLRRPLPIDLQAP